MKLVVVDIVFQSKNLMRFSMTNKSLIINENKNKEKYRQIIGQIKSNDIRIELAQ